MSDPEVLARTVVEVFRARGETVATAESLTGGLVAATLVDVPGASAVLRGGLVVYATELKHELAGVPRELLDRVGPVDPEVAAALAAGARTRCGADWGVSTTGVAGPEAQDGKPVGLVFIAVCGPLSCAVSELRLPGATRVQVRQAAVRSAFRQLLEQVGAPIPDC